MLNKSDPYYGALLVENARLHLGTVMAGQDSEPFFLTMLKIAESRVYLGYRNLRDKDVRLRGIKDFLYSVYYGLGIKDMNEFLINVTKSALNERSKNKYAYKFIDWLKTQDELFEFPQEFFEFRRVVCEIHRDRKKHKIKKHFEYKTARFLYETVPHLMVNIGRGREYKSVSDCYYKLGYAEEKKSLSSVKIYQNPTKEQLAEAGSDIFEKLGPGRSRLLALELLERCANARAARAPSRSASATGLDDSTGPDW